jgi:hypothetical protein
MMSMAALASASGRSGHEFSRQIPQTVRFGISRKQLNHACMDIKGDDFARQQQSREWQVNKANTDPDIYNGAIRQLLQMIQYRRRINLLQPRRVAKPGDTSGVHFY